MAASWQELGLEGKRLVGYGAGMAFIQMQACLPRLTLDYLVDHEASLWGKEICGVRLASPEELVADRSDDRMVIVLANTARAVAGISRELNSMGLVWGKDYLDCSDLQFETMSARLQQASGIQASRELFRRTKLLSLYSSIESLSSLAGTWLYAELLEHAPREGSIAECGVYRGGNAFITLLSSARAASRPYHLLDSFEGFPELSKHDPVSRGLEFRDVSFAGVRDVFRNFPNVQIHKGYFTQTLPALSEETFSVAYVDCDLYEPTLELCAFFYPRLAPGGCLFFHDYWVPENPPAHLHPYEGVNRAVKEFLGEDIGRLVVFPETTHAVFFKPGPSAK